MPLFKDEKAGQKAASDMKEYTDTVRKLGDEVKMLRKEVEFLSQLAKKNEEAIIKTDKNVQEINEKVKRLLNILEIEGKI
jgi:archaellum component FlaC